MVLKWGGIVRDPKNKINGKIMVVDDSIQSLHVICEGLKAEGYDVKPIPRGDLAIRSANKSKPDLILLDVVMPEMDGYTVCETLKSNPSTSDIPIIFLTALDVTESERKGLKLGAVDYISKPVDLSIVSARVHTQLELKKQRDILERQKAELMAQYEELEAFSYTASHDLKAPLTTIRTYSSFLKEHFIEVGNKEGLDDVLEIVEASEAMSTLIESLLKLAKIGNQKLVYEEIDITMMIHGIIRDLKSSDYENNAEFVVEEGLTSYGDVELVEIAFRNLIQNAMKYSSGKTSPVIEIGERAYDKAIYIKDNGIGFDMEKADRIFKPFERLHGSGSFKGTGIGLSIVKRIVDKHDKDIWFESEPNVGTTFYIGRKKDLIIKY